MMGVIVLTGIIALVIQIVVSMKFASIAEEKGYDGTNYGLLCFFLGVIGCCMVASLPDLKMQNTLSDIIRKLDKIHSQVVIQNCAAPATEPSAPTPPANNNNKSDVPTSVVTPATLADGDIICPTCGTKQLSTRKVCWSCGQKFNSNEKA